MSNEEIKIKYLEAENKALFVAMQAEVLKCEDELKVTFDNMMRYLMFIRDNGHAEEYKKYAKEKGYE